jgi:putative phosphoribosyl transferase
VVFVHGSGSSRHSPRNRRVAGVLDDAGLGTLLFDLLTPEEEADRANVFDIGLLAGRLAGVTSWLRARPHAARAAIGYFGGGAVGGGRARRWYRGRGVPRRPPRPGPPPAGRGDRADAADRRRA